MTERLLRRLGLNRFFQLFTLSDESLEYFTCLFRKSKISKYMSSSQYPAHITNTQRHNAINEILQTTEFGKIDKGQVGLSRMLKEDIVYSAYPLHDGELDSSKPLFNDTSDVDKLETTPRQRLYNTWAKYSLWYKNQPLDKIREYYGEKIGLYFAWLGAYTTWLIVPSIVGILVFLFNLMNRNQETTV